MAEKVSVIIPFYGKAQSKHLDLTVKSILNQEGVEIDLTLAGINTITKIDNPKDVQKHPCEEVPEIVRTGLVINRGLKKATGDYIYITDADTLLPNFNYLDFLTNYFKKIKTPLKRPPMRRLLLDDFDWFYNLVKSSDLTSAIKRLDFSQDYVVKQKNVNKQMRIFSKFENGRNKIFIASEKDFQDYLSNEDNKGNEPRYFNQDRHCGGIFSSIDSFFNVGGYHEGFISWGVWDADIQWKIENLEGIHLIPYEDKYNVIHLDHERGYFSKAKWEEDKKLQNKRRNLGFKQCVKEDIKIFFGDYHGR